MCILLSTTEHPDYPLVLLSNRDEFFKRPTAPAEYRNLPNSQHKILSPLDLARPEHGTWIGVTTEGKIAVLVNYKENDMSTLFSEISRGILPLEYLEYAGNETEEEWVTTLEQSILQHIGWSPAELMDPKDSPLRKIGGFTLLYGKLNIEDSSEEISHLNILSNRGDRGRVLVSSSGRTGVDDPVDSIDCVQRQTTFGLSNSLYLDPWPKVKLGEELLSKCVKKSVATRENLNEFVASCFEVLSSNTYDKKTLQNETISFAEKSLELRNSIFIPPIDLGLEISGLQPTGPAGITIGKYYGTRTQTVIILDKSGKLHYYEKNLHNSDNLDDGSDSISKHQFNIK